MTTRTKGAVVPRHEIEGWISVLNRLTRLAWVRRSKTQERVTLVGDPFAPTFDGASQSHLLRHFAVWGCRRVFADSLPALCATGLFATLGFVGAAGAPLDAKPPRDVPETIDETLSAAEKPDTPVIERLWSEPAEILKKQIDELLDGEEFGDAWFRLYRWAQDIRAPQRFVKDVYELGVERIEHRVEQVAKEIDLLLKGPENLPQARQRLDDFVEEFAQIRLDSKFHPTQALCEIEDRITDKELRWKVAEIDAELRSSLMPKIEKLDKLHNKVQDIVGDPRFSIVTEKTREEASRVGDAVLTIWEKRVYEDLREAMFRREFELAAKLAKGYTAERERCAYASKRPEDRLKAVRSLTNWFEYFDTPRDYEVKGIRYYKVPDYSRQLSVDHNFDLAFVVESDRQKIVGLFEEDASGRGTYNAWSDDGRVRRWQKGKPIVVSLWDDKEGKKGHYIGRFRFTDEYALLQACSGWMTIDVTGSDYADEYPEVGRIQIQLVVATPPRQIPSVVAMPSEPPVLPPYRLALNNPLPTRDGWTTWERKVYGAIYDALSDRELERVWPLMIEYLGHPCPYPSKRAKDRFKAVTALKNWFERFEGAPEYVLKDLSYEGFPDYFPDARNFDLVVCVRVDNSPRSQFDGSCKSNISESGRYDHWVDTERKFKWQHDQAITIELWDDEMDKTGNRIGFIGEATISGTHALVLACSKSSPLNGADGQYANDVEDVRVKLDVERTKGRESIGLPSLPSYSWSSPAVTAGQNATFDENLASGSSVLTVLATHEDPTAALSHWAIMAGNTDNDGDGNLPFAINSSSGEISVNDSGDLDRDVTASFSLSLTVWDGTNTSASQTVKIHLNDVNEFTPAVTPGQSVAINENLADRSSVLTVAATDGDATAAFSGWAITAGNTDKDGDGKLPFAINSSSGQISVNDSGDLDREVTASFSLSLTVSDSTKTSAAQTVKIYLNDLNGFAPVVTAGQSAAVDENLASGSSVLTVAATDGDATSAFSGWAITAGNTDKNSNGLQAFAINSSSGQISVYDPGELDREITASFSLSVTVSDVTKTSAAQTVTISVNDVNEFTPVVTAGQNAAVDENPASGSSVLTVAATDGDATAAFSGWAITAGNTDKDGDGNSPFAIGSSSGQITVNDSEDLDPEVTASFTLSVTVSDGTNTSAARTVTINLSGASHRGRPPSQPSAEKLGRE